MVLARAHAFVRERGDALARLRAAALLGEAPVARVEEAVAAVQDAEGAFALPVGAGGPRGVEGCLAAFAMLDDVGRLSGPAVERAVAWLAHAQNDDGSWGPPDAAHLDARVVTTGLLGGLVTRTLAARPATRAAAERFLCRAWSPDRVKSGAWGPIAAYACFFSVTDSELSDPVLQWCGRELDRAFRTRQLDALAVARIFVRCQARALPGASVTGPEVCEALRREQTEDGGWALSARALAGEPVEAALDALTALVRLP